MFHAALLLVAASGAQPAADPALDADLRCVLALTLAVAQSTDEKRTNGLMTGVMYFFGRVDGRAPHLDYKTELRRVAGPSPQLTDFVDDLNRCADILGERGEQLDRLSTIFNPD